MKIVGSLFAGFLGVTSLAVLSGCGTSAGFPNPGVPTVETALGTIQGSNYGGHAPIVGAHVFVLQAGTGGYGTAAKSLLSASFSLTTNPIYPTFQDNSGGVTNGDYYVTTDSEGDFNITGDYTCTAGLPVYVYASGGVSAVEPSSPVTAYSFSGSTATLTGANLLSVGQQVTFFGLQGGAAVLNVGTYTVTAATLTNFTVSGAVGFGSGTTAGTVQPYIPATGANNNTAIANMAVLGVCPSSGAANFSSLRYVYLNEVSTVAAAYALSGFFSNSATSLSSTDAVHLAIPIENGAGSPAWVGIANAALNASQLYNIEGLGNVSNTGDGEGHIANLTTPSGGTVPQALIDSIANALAGCVDSGNTASSPSTACTTLFANALSGTSSAGTPTGTAPKDTATAAINLAHNPWNKNASTILGLAGSTFPYAPTTSSVTDLALAITYPIAHQSAEFGGIAIDAAGNAWVTSHDDPALTKLSPQGAQTVISTYLSAITPGDVAIDTNGNAWVAIRDLLAPITYDGTYEYTSAGTLVTGSPFATTTGTSSSQAGFALADDIQVAVDANNFIYFSNHPYDNVLELQGFTGNGNANGTPVNSYANDNYTKDGPFGVAFDKNNNLWMSSNKSTNSVVQFQNGSTGGSNTNPLRAITNIPNPEAFAIDASGNVWVSDAQPTSGSYFDIWKIIPTSNTAIQVTGGGAENTVGMAVDGSGLVYAASVTGGASNTGSLAVFNNSGIPLTGGSGIDGQFTISGGSAKVPLNGPYFIAIDPSGNVWAQTNTTVVEYIGAATPVLTPLVAAVKAGTLAARP